MTFFSANVGYVLLVSKRHTWNITLQRTLGNACLARCSENETKNSSTGGDGMGGRGGGVVGAFHRHRSRRHREGAWLGQSQSAWLWGKGSGAAAALLLQRNFAFVPSFENDLDDDTLELFAVRTELGVEK